MAALISRPRLQVLAALTALALMAAALLRFPPERYGFYPACPIHQWTGLLCPGCGATRALALLLRGEFFEAIPRNGLLILVVLPCLLGCGVFVLVTGRWPQLPDRAIHLCLAMVLLFTVARNFF